MKKLCISIVLCFSFCLSTPIQAYTNKIQTIGQKSEKAEQVVLKNGTGKKIKSLRIQKASNAKTSENYLKQSWKAKEKVKLSYVVDEKDQYNLKVGIGRTIYEIEDFAFRDTKLCLNDHTLYAVPNTMQELKNQINDYLDQHTNNGEDWSVYVQMVDDKKTYVNIHSHSQQAASVIKLFVMGAVYENYEKIKPIFGKNSLIFYQKANGKDFSKINYTKNELKTVGNSKTFEIDSHDELFIKQQFKNLSQEVSLRAKKRGLISNSISITLKYTREKSRTKQMIIDHYTNDYETIYSTAILLFENIYNGESLRLVGVSINNVIHDKDLNQQMSLFQDVQPLKVEEKKVQPIDRIIDSLNLEFNDTKFMKASTLLKDKSTIQKKYLKEKE